MDSRTACASLEKFSINWCIKSLVLLPLFKTNSLWFLYPTTPLWGGKDTTAYQFDYKGLAKVLCEKWTFAQGIWAKSYKLCSFSRLLVKKCSMGSVDLNSREGETQESRLFSPQNAAVTWLSCWLGAAPINPQGLGPLRPLSAPPSGWRAFLIPNLKSLVRGTFRGRKTARTNISSSTEGALLCPSIAESEALLLDGQSTATSHNRRGLVAPLLAAAQKVGQGYTDGKGS